MCLFPIYMLIFCNFQLEMRLFFYFYGYFPQFFGTFLCFLFFSSTRGCGGFRFFLWIGEQWLESVKNSFWGQNDFVLDYQNVFFKTQETDQNDVVLNSVRPKRRHFGVCPCQKFEGIVSCCCLRRKKDGEGLKTYLEVIRRAREELFYLVAASAFHALLRLPEGALPRLR